MAAKLGLPALLGPAGRQRDLALALIISRVVQPGSKLSTLTWWDDTTLGADLGVAEASTDDIYAAMDWLEHRQDAIEAGLARRHLGPEPNPSRMALFDLSSSWLEGRRCPLAARGYSRDGKKGKLQIEYGLLTDPEGRPVAVRVFPGNTGDPGAFTAIVDVVREKFGAGADGHGRRPGDDHQRPDPGPEPAGGRDPAAGRLRVDHRAARPRHPQADGRRRPAAASLFDQQDLAEITSAGLPRRAADRLPQPGAGRRPRPHPRGPAGRHREAARPRHRPGPGRQLAGAGPIGVEVGKVISRYKTGKHFAVTITDDSLAVERRQDQIDTEAALDGFYVLRTPVPAGQLDAPAVVTAYKNLKYVERDFRHIKADDLDLRPVFHRLEERVRAHVLICMLACYLTWHLRRAWAPLTFTDENPPAPDNPVAPARRSAAAQAKASYQHDPAGQPYRSFRGLLDHLATLTRNQVRFTGTQVTVPMLTEPTSTQRQAFSLLGTAIPLTLT